MMALLIVKALRGFCDERAVRVAVAVEMLHMSTLLHDDVLDASPTRRGVPTIMAMYNPTSSVLVGDYWLSKVVDMIVDLEDGRIMKSFSRCLGDLAKGEMLQMMKAETLDTNRTDYLDIIFFKTASLFVTLAQSASRIASASDGEYEAMVSYAQHLGLAFQIMDDIMDYSPDLALGKPTGQDIIEKKITAPLLGVFENAPEEISSGFKTKMKKPDPALADEAIQLAKKYGGFDYAREMLLSEVSAAKCALETIMDSEAKSLLIKLADFMAQRRN